MSNFLRKPPETIVIFLEMSYKAAGRQCGGLLLRWLLWGEDLWNKPLTEEDNPACPKLGLFSHDLEMKKREQNRNNKRTEIERFDWFIERIKTRVAFGWLSERPGEKTSCRELSRNHPIHRFDVILQRDWPIEQCLPRIRVFFGGKTKSLCFDLFTHWLIKEITNTYRNHISRSCESWSLS